MTILSFNELLSGIQKLFNCLVKLKKKLTVLQSWMSAFGYIVIIYNKQYKHFILYCKHCSGEAIADGFGLSFLFPRLTYII